MPDYKICVGDCLSLLRRGTANSIRCCVTSPPYYGLRDYGHEGQIGLEDTPESYVARLVEVFAAVRRVLTDDGTLWLNLGDSYAAHGAGAAGKELAYMGDAISTRRARSAPEGLKVKDLIGIPWRVAFALQADGWYLRSDIIWHKPNAMPESVRDRPTKAHEYMFLLAKSQRYHYNAEAVREPAADVRSIGRRSAVNGQGSGEQGSGARFGGGEMRNRRSVWGVTTVPYKGAHFAVFPPALVEPCILAGSAVGDTVLDPFAGSGTTGAVALQHGRKFVGLELNPEYAALAHERIRKAVAA